MSASSFSFSLQSLCNAVCSQPDTWTSVKEIQQRYSQNESSVTFSYYFLPPFFNTILWNSKALLICPPSLSFLSNQWPCAINSTFTMNLSDFVQAHPHPPWLSKSFTEGPLSSVSPVSSEVLSKHDFSTSHFFSFPLEGSHSPQNSHPVMRAQMDSSNLICELISYWYPNNQSRLSKLHRLSSL